MTDEQMKAGAVLRLVAEWRKRATNNEARYQTSSLGFHPDVESKGRADAYGDCADELEDALASTPQPNVSEATSASETPPPEQAGSVGVPEGLVLLPKVPTAKMRSTLITHWDDLHDADRFSDAFDRFWRVLVLVSAAPAPKETP